MKNTPRIYIDMDGVLANLQKTLITKFGEDYKELSADVIWGNIRDNEINFFFNLDCYDMSQNFVETILEKYSDSHYVSILTALPWPTGNLISAAKDKERWIRKFIHDTIPVHTIIGGANKPQYINIPCDILIDDTQVVIDKWQNKGGIGILHTSFETSLLELENYVRL